MKTFYLRSIALMTAVLCASVLSACTCFFSPSFCDYTASYLEWSDSTTCVVEATFLDYRDRHNGIWAPLYDMRIETVLHGDLKKGSRVSLFGQDGGNCNGPWGELQEGKRYLLLFSNREGYVTYHREARDLKNPYPIHDFPGCGPAVLPWENGMITGRITSESETKVSADRLVATLEDCVGIDFAATGGGPTINYPNLSLEVNVFPNPVSEQLTISCTEEVDRIDLYDVHGRRLFGENPAPGTLQKVSVSELPGGIYFVKVFAGKKRTDRKIIVH